MESSIVGSNGPKVMARGVQPRFIGWRVPVFAEGSWGDAFRERLSLAALFAPIGFSDLVALAKAKALRRDDD